MKNYIKRSLKEYVEALAAREPVPGGGSAAALTGAVAAGLLVMAAEYSKGKTGTPAREKRLRQILKKGRSIKKRLLELVDLDAVSYLEVVKARKLKTSARKKALRQACKVPQEICRLCFKAIELTPFLVKNGNPNLISDVEVAVELFWASFRSARTMAAINQV